MGLHTDPWAKGVIKRIRDCGRTLGYVAAIDEKRITRGWVDACWIWRTRLMPHPLYLLVAEVETSKSDWPRVRSNAAKAVALRPLVYAHIFKPGIRLTAEERTQLSEIHHGRYVEILDDGQPVDKFLLRLQKTSHRFFSDKLIAFCLIVTVGVICEEFESRLYDCPGVRDAYPVFGHYDYVALLSVDQVSDISTTVTLINALRGVKSTATMIAAKTDNIAL